MGSTTLTHATEVVNTGESSGWSDWGEAGGGGEAGHGETLVVTTREAKTNTKRKRQPRYHVILLDDNDHSYAYVIAMLGSLFGFSQTKAFELAAQVDATGQVILLTTTREHAELKQEQIHAFGADPLIPKCKGSMSAVLEPATDA